MDRERHLFLTMQHAFRFLFFFLPLLSLFACRQTRELPTEPPHVEAIFPSSDSLPENLLRMYLLFSKPMKTVGNLERIRLLDAQGKEIKGAIFNNVYELWDAEQRQLTILFDPGRVKTGLVAHQELGRALQPGKTYQLKLDGLEDIHHQPLSKPFVKTFFVTPVDTLPPDTDQWVLSPPPSRSKTPLILRFPDIIDHASLLHRFVVVGPTNNALPGKVQITDQEREWQFHPGQKWRAGTYTLYVNARLADPAGNNLNGLFDHKAGSLKYEKEGEILKIPFLIPASD